MRRIVKIVQFIGDNIALFCLGVSLGAIIKGSCFTTVDQLFYRAYAEIWYQKALLIALMMFVIWLGMELLSNKDD